MKQFGKLSKLTAFVGSLVIGLNVGFLYSFSFSAAVMPHVPEILNVTPYTYTQERLFDYEPEAVVAGDISYDRLIVIDRTARVAKNTDAGIAPVLKDALTSYLIKDEYNVYREDTMEELMRHKRENVNRMLRLHAQGRTE